MAVRVTSDAARCRVDVRDGTRVRLSVPSIDICRLPQPGCAQRISIVALPAFLIINLVNIIYKRTQWSAKPNLRRFDFDSIDSIPFDLSCRRRSCGCGQRHAESRGAKLNGDLCVISAKNRR